MGDDEFEGLEIKVSFMGDNLVDVSQLSGGQKTVVSIAFLFALQKVDSSPFYIFDEVDCNLDGRYRRHLAGKCFSCLRNYNYLNTFSCVL